MKKITLILLITASLAVSCKKTEVATTQKTTDTTLVVNDTVKVDSIKK